MGIHKLTALEVKAIKGPCLLSDGGNLYVAADRLKSGKLSVRYTFICKIGGKRREGGLGAVDRISLKDVRAVAAEWRAAIIRGEDPIEVRRALKDARKSSRTFAECAEGYFKSKSPSWSDIHRRQWQHSIKVHCKALLNRDVASIDRAAVLSVLSPLWEAKSKTAAKVRARLEGILGYAVAHGLRPDATAAQWKGNLDAVFSTRAGTNHFPALPYADIAAFLDGLRQKEGPGPAALEFLILTATRSAEAIGAVWSEIDLDKKIWTIPADRMKSGREHRIPLSPRVVEIVEAAAKNRQSEFLFPGKISGKPIGAALLRSHVPGATVHGFRSSFRDWCGEETIYPREIAEAALAHVTGDATEQAYRRGDALEKRRKLMEAWGAYCSGEAETNVIQMRK